MGIPGLRIAPPEAPVTGYMFGKGIYFADMFSKSANYCYANNSTTAGVLLLCEVYFKFLPLTNKTFIPKISGIIKLSCCRFMCD